MVRDMDIFHTTAIYEFPKKHYTYLTSHHIYVSILLLIQTLLPGASKRLPTSYSNELLLFCGDVCKLILKFFNWLFQKRQNISLLGESLRERES